MYSFLISISVALVVGLGGALAGLWGWVGGILLGLLAFAITWVLILRSFSKRLGPAMQRVQAQTEARMMQPALETLADLLPLGDWIPMLRGQVYAQMGALSHFLGEEDQALDYLGKASRRASDGQMLRAAILYRRGDVATALGVLEAAEKPNRKRGLLANAHAWLLHKEGRTEDAMARLARFLQRDKENEAAKDNLLRLQNGKKLNMKPFGAEWYALGFERPPNDMGQMGAPRKGFRQPPKNKGKRQQKSKR